MDKTVVPIRGMHCRSCELLIEDELKAVSGVKNAVVSQKKGCAEIYHEENNLDIHEVQTVIEGAGYKMGMEEDKPFLSKNPQDYVDVLLSVIALFLLYILADVFGLRKLFETSSFHPSSLFAVLLIGLTAGFSTCMALIGGLVLGVSARFSEKYQDVAPFNRFKPHLLFNAGRILSYLFFGGVIGVIGSSFQLSGFNLGLVTLGVALVMFMLGLQLTGLFPRISNTSFTLPKSVGRFLGISQQQNKEYSHQNSFILGATTFFLPCGFTQAMQLFAISSGSFTKGAAIMGVFALGTVPGLLGIGGLTSVIKGIFAAKFYKFAGVVVMILAVFNASNGLNLMGLSPQYLVSASDINNQTKINDGIQVIKMTQSSNGYTPNVFTVVKDVPVKWVITSVDPNSCASSILSSKLNIRQNLHPGENIIEFTPKETGKIPFSCSMGMFGGIFEVIEKNM